MNYETGHVYFTNIPEGVWSFHLMNSPDGKSFMTLPTEQQAANANSKIAYPRGEVVSLTEFCQRIAAEEAYTTPVGLLKRLANVGAIRASGFNKFVPTEYGLALLEYLRVV